MAVGSAYYNHHAYPVLLPEECQDSCQKIPKWRAQTSDAEHLHLSWMLTCIKLPLSTPRRGRSTFLRHCPLGEEGHQCIGDASAGRAEKLSKVVGHHSRGIIVLLCIIVFLVAQLILMPVCKRQHIVVCVTMTLWLCNVQAKPHQYPNAVNPPMIASSKALSRLCMI